jgi:hypothetical protein
MSQSFWKNAADSLPPQVARRYAAKFEKAEEYEQLLDWIMGAWRSAGPKLMTSCKAAARRLRKAGRNLRTAARRRLLPH